MINRRNCVIKLEGGSETMEYTETIWKKDHILQIKNVSIFTRDQTKKSYLEKIAKSELTMN